MTRVESVGATVSLVRVIDVELEESPSLFVAETEMVIGPSARLEASMPENARVPPPSIPISVAVTIVVPSVSSRVTVSLPTDVDASATSNERFASFVPLMYALPVPVPFVRATGTGASGAIATRVLWGLSTPTQLWNVGVTV